LDDQGYAAGAAFKYRKEGASWIETKILPPDGVAYDQYGKSAALSYTGRVTAAGRVEQDQGSYRGSIYLYR